LRGAENVARAVGIDSQVADRNGERRHLLAGAAGQSSQQLLQLGGGIAAAAFGQPRAILADGELRQGRPIDRVANQDVQFAAGLGGDRRPGEQERPVHLVLYEARGGRGAWSLVRRGGTAEERDDGQQEKGANLTWAHGSGTSCRSFAAG